MNLYLIFNLTMIEANERINRKHACFVDVALIGSKEDRNFIILRLQLILFFFFLLSENIILAASSRAQCTEHASISSVSDITESNH